jgi:hypothetical protein
MTASHSVSVLWRAALLVLGSAVGFFGARHLTVRCLLNHGGVSRCCG